MVPLHRPYIISDEIDTASLQTDFRWPLRTTLDTCRKTEVSMSFGTMTVDLRWVFALRLFHRLDGMSYCVVEALIVRWSPWPWCSWCRYFSEIWALSASKQLVLVSTTTWNNLNSQRSHMLNRAQFSVSFRFQRNQTYPDLPRLVLTENWHCSNPAHMPFDSLISSGKVTEEQASSPLTMFFSRGNVSSSSSTQRLTQLIPNGNCQQLSKTCTRTQAVPVGLSHLFPAFRIIASWFSTICCNLNIPILLRLPTAPYIVFNFRNIPYDACWQGMSTQ